MGETSPPHDIQHYVHGHVAECLQEPKGLCLAGVLVCVGLRLLGFRPVLCECGVGGRSWDGWRQLQATRPLAARPRPAQSRGMGLCSSSWAWLGGGGGHMLSDQWLDGVGVGGMKKAAACTFVLRQPTASAVFMPLLGHCQPIYARLSRPLPSFPHVDTTCRTRPRQASRPFVHPPSHTTPSTRRRKPKYPPSSFTPWRPSSTPSSLLTQPRPRPF